MPPVASRPSHDKRVKSEVSTEALRLASRGQIAVSPPRHCMVVYAHYPLAETRVQRQAEMLARAGYAVNVICLRDGKEAKRDVYRGVHIERLSQIIDKRSLGHQLASYLEFMMRATVRLTAGHLRRPYQSIQIHNLPDFLVFCALVPKLLGVPVILDLHDLMPEFFASRFGSRDRGAARLVRLQERLSCRFANHVITVSDHWKDALVQRGVPEKKISVVMNVADESIFSPRAKGSSDSEFRLIYHGTITHRYGLDLALRAVALVHNDIPEIRLTILGDGDLMPQLFALRRTLGLEEIVELRDGFVPAEDLPEIIGRADAGIVPYRNDVFTDGLLPTKLMEYAVMALPSVAARTTAIERYFSGAMVEFFEPGDEEDLARAIRVLHGDRKHFLALKSRSHNFVRRHNWETVGGQYVNLVEKLGA